MISTPLNRVLVVHSGALGDHVLIWPLLRALAHSGSRVTLACRSSHAALSRQYLGAPLQTLDIEHPRFTRLWSGDQQPDSALTADLVLSFLADPADPASRVWHAAARAAFDARESLFVGPPASESRGAIWARYGVEQHACPPLQATRPGPLVLYVGAGSRDKQWPLGYWIALAGLLRPVCPAISLLAGEVEQERFTRQDHVAFAQCGGRFAPSLLHLAQQLAGARLFIGADTGPSHLAAQLGVPTIALFGPTDPAIWSPVGPCVCTLAPPSPAPMNWIEPAVVAARARELLALTH